MIKIFKPDINNLKKEIEKAYNITVYEIQHLRNVGGAVFLIKSKDSKYIFKLYPKEIKDCALKAFMIARFLEENNFDALRVIPASDGFLCTTEGGDSGYLCRYIDADNSCKCSMKKTGEYIANAHAVLSAYPHELPNHGKSHYIDRLIACLYECGFDKHKISELKTCGNELWKRIEHLEKDAIHGDLNQTNILTDSSAKLYLIDLDNVCVSFLWYDCAALCESFRHKPYTEEQMITTKQRFFEFCEGYSGYEIQPDMELLHDFITLRRFELNGVMMKKMEGSRSLEFYNFIDKEFDNLIKWMECDFK